MKNPNLLPLLLAWASLGPTTYPEQSGRATGPNNPRAFGKPKRFVKHPYGNLRDFRLRPPK